MAARGPASSPVASTILEREEASSKLPRGDGGGDAAGLGHQMRRVRGAAAVGGAGARGTAETRDLCATCTLNYYYRTGGLGPGSNNDTTSAAAGQQTTSPFSFAAAAAASGPPAAEKEAAPAKEPGRCGACRRKTGLLGFACRCGGTFCAAHRHADAHGCGFDFGGFDRKRIAGENPRVAAPKVAKVSTERESSEMSLG